MLTTGKVSMICQTPREASLRRETKNLIWMKNHRTGLALAQRETNLLVTVPKGDANAKEVRVWRGHATTAESDLRLN